MYQNYLKNKSKIPKLIHVIAIKKDSWILDNLDLLENSFLRDRLIQNGNFGPKISYYDHKNE